MSKRELLFSVTAKDCEFQATKGSGSGGQHRNKTSSAIRCSHKASGSVGYAEDERSQHRNKKIAFGRMARSKKMQDWLKLEAAKLSGELANIETKVEKQLNEKLLLVEVHNQKGLWVELKNLEESIDVES